MRTTILLTVLALAAPAWAQAPAAAPAPAPEPKTITKQAKVAAKKPSVKRLEDARHCLQLVGNDAVIRCAEEYL